MNRVEPNKPQTLSIRVSTNGFCFSSYSADNPESLSYHYYECDEGVSLTANFEKAWAGCSFSVSKQFAKVQVIIETSDFGILPAEYDKAENYENYFYSCFPHLRGTSKLVYNRMNAQGITVLFAVDSTLYNRLRQIGELTFYTPASILLGYVARYPLEEEQCLLAYFNNKKSLLLSFENGRLKLANSFVSNDPHDQLFYLLSIWNEQDLSQTENLLILCGDKSVEELTPLISQFIRRYKRINPNEEFHPSLLNKIKEIPFDLQILILCE